MKATAYYKATGSYGGAAKINGRWRRFACCYCLLAMFPELQGKRVQGIPLAASRAWCNDPVSIPCNTQYHQ